MTKKYGTCNKCGKELQMLVFKNNEKAIACSDHGISGAEKELKEESIVTPEKIAAKVLQNEIESAISDLGKFKSNLETNPKYAFEWGDSAIEAAAKLGVYPRILKALEKCIPVNINLIFKEVREDVEFKARCDEHSTGQCSNLVARAELKALANFLDKLEWAGVK